jgi:cell division topological specificity factor
MGLLDLFRKTPNTASVAKERLRIIVAQERSARSSGTPDYLPLLRRELLEVIIKYVNVDPAAVQVNFGRESGHEVLEFSVLLPEAARRA